MKCIGRGYYYDVYDLGGNRVLKRRTGHARRLRKLLEWYGGDIRSNIRIQILYPAYAWRAIRALKHSKYISTLDPALFGSPTFRNNFEYEQDKGILLKDYFKEHDIEESKMRVDEYLICSKALWQYGFADTVFNFTLNNAVSCRTGKLIFVDFNEFSESKEVVSECIKNEVWAEQHSLKRIGTNKLKEYVLDRMKDEFTLESLDQFWARQAPRSRSNPRLAG